MRIRVTKLDIARGVKCSSTSCPVARAIRRAVNWNKDVADGSHTVTFESPSGQEREGVLPVRVTEFINTFDLGGTPEPISFQLVKPEPFKRGRPAW